MIRTPQESDRERWCALFQAYGVFYKTEFSDEQLDHVWSLLTRPGAGVDALVAEHDGAVVGFAHYRSHPDTFSPGLDWYLDDLYVDPAARGLGLATALIEAVAELARATPPVGTLRWITASDNDRAQRVYDRIAKKTSWVTYEMRP